MDVTVKYASTFEIVHYPIAVSVVYAAHVSRAKHIDLVLRHLILFMSQRYFMVLGDETRHGIYNHFTANFCILPEVGQGADDDRPGEQRYKMPCCHVCSLHFQEQ